MPPHSWLTRRLRSRPIAQRAAGAARQTTARATVRRWQDRRGRPPETRRLVVCGDDPMALRLIEELITRYSAEVIAIVPNRRRNRAPHIARLPGVRVIESERLDVEAFRQARLAHADALALVKQDDVGNIHAALQAQEVNPRIRLVVRMFNMRLGHGVRRLFHDCAVLSDAAMAAPSFVSAALGEVAPVHVRLQGKTLYVARRRDVRAEDVVCGLARTASGSDRTEMFPSDPASADLVLAMANGTRRGGPPIVLSSAQDAMLGSGQDGALGSGQDGALGSGEDGALGGPQDGALGSGQDGALGGPQDGALGSGQDGMLGGTQDGVLGSGQNGVLGDGRSGVRGGRRRRRGRQPLAALRSFISPKLRLAVLTLIALLVTGTVALGVLQHNLTWWNAAYVTVLTAFGGAEPDLKASPAVKILQAFLTVISIALVPLLTAAVVEGVVNARLLRHARLRAPIADHVVVFGLGNVGTRVLSQLHALGVDVVAVDRSQTARGAPVAEALGVPLIIGDASREETLRAASVQTCRALLCLSTDDVTNLEATLYGRNLKEDLRVILRLYDGDFADRVERVFGVAVSRSVSYVAAPEFAAAMMERQVIGTIPINRRVLLIAEAPICAGSPLEGRTIAEANEVGPARVIAMAKQRGPRQVRWSPEATQVLAADDVLTVVATRRGLARMLAEAGDPVARTSGPDGAPPGSSGSVTSGPSAGAAGDVDSERGAARRTARPRPRRSGRRSGSPDA